MDIIYIDTSIFESENFTEGSKLKQLIELGQKDMIKLLLPEITYREVVERIRKKLKDAKSSYKKIYSDCRVLRNSDNFKKVFAINEVDVDRELENIKSKFDELIKLGKVEVIPYPIVDISSIFGKYFENKPPFKEGEKKNEFPDAFAIETVEQWCKKYRKKCFVLCKDNDILTVDNDIFTPIEDFPKYINGKVIELQKIEHHQEKLQLIDNAYNKNKETLKLELENDLREILEEHFKYDYSSNISLDSISINILDISEYSINYIRENDADIELRLRVEIKAKLIYGDYGSAHYDKEDDTWFFVDTIEGKISREIDIDVTLTVEFNPPSGREYAYIKIKSINNDRMLKI
jgi:hypothetical protein